MTKNEFLAVLERRFAGLPAADREDRLSFYGEMIDDRVEEGLSEEAAIADIGSIDSVVSNAIASIPLGSLVREKISRGRRLSGWAIALIAVGSPIWLALLISLFAVALSVFAALWAVVVSLWAVDLALAVALVGGVGTGAVLLFTASVPSALFVIGAGLVSGALSIFWFFGAKYTSIGMAKLSRLCLIGIKKLFI